MRVAFCKVTAVCAKILPFIDASVWSTPMVLLNKIPSRCPPDPTTAQPATCQKTFFADAPTSITFFPFAILRDPAIWKIQTSLGSPDMTTSPDAVTLVVHMYRPGTRVSPPMAPPPRLKKLGLARPEASR